MTRHRSNVEVGSTIVQEFANLRNDYDMARPSIYRRPRRGMIPTGSGADYHYRTDNYYFGMMEMSRELMRNNVVVGQGVRRMVANVIQDGFTLDPKTGDDKIDDDLEAWWTEWSESKSECEVQGEFNFHDIEDMVLQNVVVDGDIFDNIPPYENAMQLIEAHRCRTPTNSRKNIIHGVKVDSQRRRLGYYFTKDDVDLSQAIRKVSDTNYYDARDAAGNRQILHLYRPDRMSQTRGVTSFAPSGDTCGMGDDLFFAQLVKAQVASCYTILRSMKGDMQPPIPSDKNAKGEVVTEKRPDGSTKRIEGTSPGMEIFSYLGEELSGFSPNIPNPEFFSHATLILTFISINLDLPLMVFLLDPSKTNFSGWRGAMDQAKMRFRKFQRWLIDHFHSEVYRWKVRQRIARDPILKAAKKRQGINLFGHEWTPPAWPYIEPLKDATADVVIEKNAQDSPRRLAAKRNRNFWKITDEIIEDNSYRIIKAKKKAEKINKDINDGNPVHWRELISMAMPDGMKIAVTASSDEDTDGGGEQKTDKQKQDDNNV